VPERRYLAILFSTAALLTLLIAALNFIVNPLGIYRGPVIAGFNDVHPATTAFERLHKAEREKQLKPDVVVTGTSRADSGMDPREEFFPGSVSYNYGLSASSVREQRAVLEYCQRVHPLKKLVLTLDFFAFNAKHLDNRAFEPARLSPEALAPTTAFFNTYGTIVSLDILLASIKHLQALRHIERHGYILPNGRKDDADIAYDIAQNGIRQRFGLSADARAAENFDDSAGFDDFSFAYSDKPGDTSFQHFAAMLDFARQNNIEVVMFISPTHWDPPDGHAPTERELQQKEWRKRLVEIDKRNARRYGAAPYPLWDFDTPNSLTLEPVPEQNSKRKDMRWFWDAGHYRKELGDIILRRILGLPNNAPPDFGTRLV
jgi:hypothetical protein